MEGAVRFGCDFLEGVVCPHKKREGFGDVMEKCEDCPHYYYFIRGMEEDEDAFFDEAERTRRMG